MAVPSGSANRSPRLADYSSLRASAPRAVGVCNRCRRCLVHSRMYLVAGGEGDMCKTCNHLAAVTNAMATSLMSTDDEEEALELLEKVYRLVRRQRDWARGGQRSAPYAAGEGSTTSVAEQPLPGPDVMGPSESTVPNGSEQGPRCQCPRGRCVQVASGLRYCDDCFFEAGSDPAECLCECAGCKPLMDKYKARGEKNLNKLPKGGQDA